MDRLERLGLKLKDSHHVQTLYHQLSQPEKTLLIDLVAKQSFLSDSDYRAWASRLFINDQNKPKNWTILTELALAALPPMTHRDRQGDSNG